MLNKFKELLKKNGVSEETVEKVISEMATGKMYLTGQENMDVRYPKLKGDYDNLDKQYKEASTLIETLKKNGTDNADLQKKIGDYEKTVTELKAQLDKTNLDNVYAGGDNVTGAATVILAMGAGKNAAKAILKMFEGK